MKKLHVPKHILLIALGVLAVVVIFGAAAVYIRNKHEQKNTSLPASTTTSISTGQKNTSKALDLPSAQRMTRNALRESEANRLLANTADFVNNNAGNFPTVYSDGRLTSPDAEFPATSTMTHYQSVSFASGAQSGVSDDSLRLVTNATCNADGSTGSGSNREYVAQFGYEEEGGNFSSHCIKS
jgi:hypothetical protein